MSGEEELILKMLETLGIEVEVQFIGEDEIEFLATTVAMKDIYSALAVLDDEMIDAFIAANNQQDVPLSKQYMVPLMSQLVDEFVRPAVRFVHDKMERAIADNNPSNN